MGRASNSEGPRLKITFPGSFSLVFGPELIYLLLGRLRLRTTPSSTRVPRRWPIADGRASG